MSNGRGHGGLLLDDGGRRQWPACACYGRLGPTPGSSTLPSARVFRHVRLRARVSVTLASPKPRGPLWGGPRLGIVADVAVRGVG
eukprot:6385278-Alexandrium_andersonii.AAC.1